MNWHRIRYFFGHLSILTLIAGSLPALADSNLPAPEFSDCVIGKAPFTAKAQCTHLDVPLTHDTGASESRIRLKIARIPARRRSGHSDAFTLLAGGPGQSALHAYPAMAQAFRHISRDRDIILIDQRGTGDSAPLNCSGVEDLQSTGSKPDELQELARQCLNALPHDPRFFTTSMAVKDLELVREFLGVSRWNILGVSYGTRVAQYYLKRFPASVRTLILDAVLPIQISLGPDAARFAQQALERIFNRCENAPGCQRAFGSLGPATADLVRSLEAQPRTLSFENIAMGSRETRVFTHQDLIATLRLMSYTSQTAAILPSMLHDAISNDNLAPLARQSESLAGALDDAIAVGMYYSVVCTEDMPFIENNDLEAATEEFPLQNEQFISDDALLAILSVCEVWPEGLIDDGFKLPEDSDIATLILSGGADPITPPSYGRQVAGTLTNSYHLVNPQEGHGQVSLGCIPVLIARFIDQASVDAIDNECLERIRPLPFFIDANGPLP